MEVPIQVAVRLRPPDIPDSPPWLVTDPISQSVITGSGQVFHVDNALPLESTQAYLYSSIVSTQVNCFLDGCDTSIVMFGQSKTGKTYTLLGPGADSIYGDQDRGIIPRFIQDVFQRLHQASERSFIIHLTWMRVVNGSVMDLLGCGLVRCSSVAEAFQYLNKGSMNECYEPCHTVFTVSIEQKWIGAGGFLHHRLSTASFCELSAYPEPSLHSLDDIIKSLLQPLEEKVVNYEQSLLTAMLRDSFGGRAFTWIICCLSSDLRHSEESVKNLELCWCCRGVHNFVTVNGFADNNTPVAPEKELNRAPEQLFGLQFAAQQWIKLVSNAEGLFQNLLQSNMIGEAEAAQINEWLFLKAECDECLTPTVGIVGSDGDIENEDAGVNKQALPRIAEDTEPSELSDSDRDTDTDTSVQHDDFLFSDKLCKFMEFFREKTDELASDRCEEYLHCGESDENLDNSDTCLSESSAAHAGRRKTIQPGESLTGSELELLRRAAAKAISPESQKIILESHKTYEDAEPKLVQRELLKMIDSPVPNENCKKYKTLLQKYSLKQSLVTKLSKEIEDGEAQLKELFSLCLAKEQLIQDLSKIVKRQNNVNKCTEKQSNLKEEYEKAKADLVAAQAKYIVGNGNPRLSQQVRKCKSIVDHYERRVQDLEVSKRVDCDSNKEIKKHETKLKAYRKQIEQVKKQIKRDEKRKSTLEIELIKDKSKLDEMYEKDISNQCSELKTKEKKQPTLKQVSARITHLDHILKEKSSDLQKCELSDDKESMLRREIRNLRRTRECLIDQRCTLGQKRKTHKSLSDTEERKILECEEAIEAIDTAIEYKNELICGKGQVKEVGAGQRRERGEEMLMARLSKLSDNEMRTLLYKYFQKVIDLRGTCVSLEAQAGAAQREAGGWRRRCADAWAALHHARLMHARRTTTLTARHYHTLNQLMREMTGDTESDSSVYGNNICGRIPLPLEYPPGGDYGNTDSEADNVLTQHSRIAATTAKIKLKDHSAEGNARFLDGIQHLARYHQSTIPTQNLKQLQPASRSPATRVTRQKNKLVIVQEDKSNK